jgi:hypothetical protein
MQQDDYYILVSGSCFFFSTPVMLGEYFHCAQMSVKRLVSMLVKMSTNVNSTLNNKNSLCHSIKVKSLIKKTYEMAYVDDFLQIQSVFHVDFSETL